MMVVTAMADPSARSRAAESVAARFTRVMNAATSRWGVITDPPVLALATGVFLILLLASLRIEAAAGLVPIFGVVSSVLILGESLRTNLAAGGVLVLAGLWLAESRRLHSPRASDRAAVPAPVGDGRDQRHA